MYVIREAKMKRLLLYVLCLFLACSCSQKKEPELSPLPGVKPGSAEHLSIQGIFFLKSGNLPQAEMKFKQALEKDANLTSALNGMGLVNLSRMDFSKAETYFRKVVEINPDKYDTYNYLGVIYSETGRYDLAKENLLIAANADAYRTPENAYANLARLEIGQDRMESAFRYANKGIEKNRRFAPLYNLRGIIFESEGRLDKALEDFNRGLALLSKDDADLLINIARVHSKMGEKSKALDALERALSRAITQTMKEKIQSLIDELEKK